jgi:hypothetical protein
MKILDTVGCTFVNTVIGRGSLNGVINLSFATFNWTPSDDGSRVDPDPAVSCRLRMDKMCAVQLRDVMNELIQSIEEAEAKVAMGINPNNEEDVLAKPSSDKIN